MLRPYRKLQFALVLTAILAQCVALANFPLLVVAGTLAFLSWHITEGPHGRAVPPWVARLLVLVVFLYAVFDAIGPVSRLPMALGQFAVWLTIIKLYGKRTGEFEAQILLLSLLLMTVGALYATNFLFGLILVVWSGFAVWVLLLFQLHHGMKIMREERVLAVLKEHPAPLTRPVAGLHLKKEFRRTFTILLTLGLVSSFAFFLVTPRETFEVLSDSFIARDSGLERIELHPERDILLSTRQVMTVSLRDASGTPIHMTQGLRLRGKVLDAYLGDGVWEASMHMRSTVLTSESKMTPIETESDRQTIFMEVELQQPVNILYSLYRPISLETTPPTRISLNTMNSTMRLSLGSPKLRSYRVEVDFEKTVTSSSRQKRYFYSNDDVRDLAIQLLDDAGLQASEIQKNPLVNMQVARVFASYLQSEEFRYTTDVSSLTVVDRVAFEEDEDPVATFLFTHKQGHCEFFAAAMVALCDTVDLPARIVTGFYVDRWDTMTSKYIVLERDAHAWVEVESEPMAWVTFDPTPTADGSPTQQKAMTFTQRIHYEWKMWEAAWTANVIGYDALAQGKLFDFVAPFWRSHTSELLEQSRRAYSWLIDWFDIGAVGRLWIDLVMGALALAGTSMLLIRWQRRRAENILSISLSTQEDVPTVHMEFYARVQRALFRSGKVRPVFVPARTWVESLSLEGESSTLAVSLTETYYQIRFGSYRPSRGERLKLMQAVHRFEALLQKDKR